MTFAYTTALAQRLASANASALVMKGKEQKLTSDVENYTNFIGLFWLFVVSPDESPRVNSCHSFAWLITSPGMKGQSEPEANES